MDIKGKFLSLKITSILEYGFFILVLVLYEDRPHWLLFDWIPIKIDIILLIIRYLYFIFIKHELPKLNYRNLCISFLLFGCSLFCYKQITPWYTFTPSPNPAEDNNEDYLRIWASLYNMFIGIGLNWFWEILPSQITLHPPTKNQ